MLIVGIRSLHSVSLSECPVSRLEGSGAAQLQQLNLSNTAVADWAEVDRLRGLPGLTHLRMMDCPFNRSDRVDTCSFSKRSKQVQKQNASTLNLNLWWRKLVLGDINTKIL